MKAAIATGLILICVFLFVTGCTHDYLTDGDYYFIKNDGAVLPVWVKGNIDSGVFLITVHGGPGTTSGTEFAISPGFSRLESEYAVVYWDQRYTGISQGEYDETLVTVPQFVEDTEKVVQFIRHQYGNPTLFVLGHSWGGALSAAFLGKDNNQDLVNGWIDLDGSIRDDLEAQEMKTWILDRVPEQLAKSPEPAFWHYIVEWYDDHPGPLSVYDPQYALPYLYLDILGGNAHHWAETQAEYPTPYVDLIFASPMTFAFYLSDLDSSLGIGIDMTDDLTRVTIPSLLLWGADDGNVPPAIATYVYDNLSTDTAQKEIVLISDCAHSPHYDQPEAFAAAVGDFMEQYR